MGRILGVSVNAKYIREGTQTVTIKSIKKSKIQRFWLVKIATRR